ncbi:hypothetical protein SAMN05661099_1214 [Daejeonella lutea]|uniref:Uncharacterized protein n=1 Tax=Daejeonella lutea TaxID=572036 RepID=A0A1T5B1X7_9SPHI|nr:hypothetical protein SAMN05661099_1214 [Daejeonella lutea]
MKNNLKTRGFIKSKIVFKFKKRSANLLCSGGTVDPTTITNTVSLGC